MDQGESPNMAKSKPLIAEQRSYLVTTVAQAKNITASWLGEIELSNVISLGLPEVDDRYHVWRVPLLALTSGIRIGEVGIDAFTTEIPTATTTQTKTLHPLV